MILSKDIKVVSRNIVTTSRGRCMGPIHTYTEKVSYILGMISQGAKVVEVIDGQEIELNELNFDKDNRKPVEVKVQMVPVTSQDSDNESDSKVEESDEDSEGQIEESNEDSEGQVEEDTDESDEDSEGQIEESNEDSEEADQEPQSKEIVNLSSAKKNKKKNKNKNKQQNTQAPTEAIITEE